jgi:hypothetical protein
VRTSPVFRSCRSSFFVHFSVFVFNVITSVVEGECYEYIMHLK